MITYRTGRIAEIRRIENGWILTWAGEEVAFLEWEIMMGWLRKHAMWEDL